MCPPGPEFDPLDFTLPPFASSFSEGPMVQFSKKIYENILDPKFFKLSIALVAIDKGNITNCLIDKKELPSFVKSSPLF